jgi:hypothetical protein
MILVVSAHPASIDDRGDGAYIRRMRNLGVALLLAALFGLLAASLWYAYGLWTSLEDTDLPPGLYIAMAGGVLFSLLVGCGLMALVFYSSRHGYDDRAASGDHSD